MESFLLGLRAYGVLIAYLGVEVLLRLLLLVVVLAALLAGDRQPWLRYHAQHVGDGCETGYGPGRSEPGGVRSFAVRRTKLRLEPKARSSQ